MSQSTIKAVLLGCVLVMAAGSHCGAMDLREALGHFESGATTPKRSAADGKIGSRREVSRFQILPSLWREYGRGADYRDPEAAWKVAEKILAERYAWFKNATGREWDAVDLYLMWNAPGAYQKAKWDRKRVSAVVRDRAERFANLMESDERVLVRAKVP